MEKRKAGEPRKKKLDFMVTEKGCFECTSHIAHRVNKSGQKASQIYYRGRNWLLYRVIYTEMYGEIPEGHVVRHKCDNSMCINPEHLEIGTQSDNMQDCIKRGRNTMGKPKLTAEEVHEIRFLYAIGHAKEDLAHRYQVTKNNITHIINERTWKPLDMERRRKHREGLEI